MDETKIETSEVCLGIPSVPLRKWWPIGLGPVSMILVYLATASDMAQLVSRATNEQIAMPLLAVSIIGFSFRAIRLGSEFHFFMAVLCVAFFFREWHFVGTSNGIYVALVCLIFWAVKRTEVLRPLTESTPIRIWAISTAATYILSQLIARRVFHYLHLPQEGHIHVLLEETVETTAHVMMIITCLVSWKSIKRD